MWLYNIIGEAYHFVRFPMNWLPADEYLRVVIINLI